MSLNNLLRGAERLAGRVSPLAAAGELSRLQFQHRCWAVFSLGLSSSLVSILGVLV